MSDGSPGTGDGWTPRPPEELAETAPVPEREAPPIDRALVIELAKLANPKSSWTRNIGMLVISVVLFFSLGLADEPLSAVLIIVAALLVHETGHVLGMKLLGYRNVSMLFIPFLGAAVSGRNVRAAGWKRAVVTLMGPLTGFVAAFGLFVLWLRTAEPLAGKAALVFAFLNVFNMLPFYPLDGGRFLQQTLFSRSRYLEAVFRVIMGGLTVLVSVWLEAWILAALGAFVILGTGFAFRIGTVAKRLRERPGFPEVVDPAEVSAEVVAATQREIRRSFPPAVSPTIEANHIWMAWQKLNARPPEAVATLGLVLIFLLSLVAVPVAPVAYISFATEVSVVEAAGPERPDRFRGVPTSGPEGPARRMLVARVHAFTVWEADLDGKDLYHGANVDYFFGTKTREGAWRDGMPDGEWVSYGRDGNPLVTVVFDRGEFVTRRDHAPGGVTERKLGELPESYRALLAGLRAGGPYGLANRFGRSEEVTAPLP